MPVDELTRVRNKFRLTVFRRSVGKAGNQIQTASWEVSQTDGRGLTRIVAVSLVQPFPSV